MVTHTIKKIGIIGLLLISNGGVNYQNSPLSYKFTQSFMENFRANGGMNIDTSATASNGYRRVTEGIRITDLINRDYLPGGAFASQFNVTKYSRTMYYLITSANEFLSYVPKSVAKLAIEGIDTDEKQQTAMDTWSEFVSMAKSYDNYEGNFKSSRIVRNLSDIPSSLLSSARVFEVSVDKDKNLITKILGIKYYNGTQWEDISMSSGNVRYYTRIHSTYTSGLTQDTNTLPSNIQTIVSPDMSTTYINFDHDDNHSEFYQLREHGLPNTGLYSDNAYAITSTPGAKMDKNYRYVAFRLKNTISSSDAAHYKPYAGYTITSFANTWRVYFKFYSTSQELENANLDENWFKGIMPRRNSPLIDFGNGAYKLSFDPGSTTGASNLQIYTLDNEAPIKLGVPIDSSSGKTFDLRTDTAKWLAIISRNYDVARGTDQKFVNYEEILARNTQVIEVEGETVDWAPPEENDQAGDPPTLDGMIPDLGIF